MSNVSILQKSAMKIFTMIQQAFGDQILSRTQVFQTHTWFKTSRTSVDNEDHTERSTSCTTSETVAWTQELVHQDWRQTIHNTAEEVGIGYGTCQWVLMKELGMHHFAAKFMPRILTPHLQLLTSPSSFRQTPKSLSSPPTVLPSFSTCDFSYFQKLKWSSKDASLIPLRRSRPNRRVLDTLTEKDFHEAF
jgi:hypothetical protein